MAVATMDGTVRISDAVIHAGEATIYRRGTMLVVSNARGVDLERDMKKIVEISRFSRDYFDLVAKKSKAENVVLARQGEGQEMLIRLHGQVYLIK